MEKDQPVKYNDHTKFHLLKKWKDGSLYKNEITRAEWINKTVNV